MKIFQTILLSLAMLLIFSGVSQAQRVLALDKPGKVKRLYFNIGDRIHFKLRGEKVKNSGYITAINERTVRIGGAEVPVDEISSITIKNRYKSGILQGGSYVLPLAGVVYFGMDAFNPGNSLSTSTYIISGSFIGTGLGLLLFKNKTYRINNTSRKVQIIDLNIQKSNTKTIAVKGSVLNADDRLPVFTEVVFENDSTGEKTSVVSDGVTGNFDLKLPRGQKYRYYITAENYLLLPGVIDLAQYESYSSAEILLRPVFLKPGRVLEIDDLLFRQGEAVLERGSETSLENVFTLLNKIKPDLKIEIGGHTDSKGDEKENIALSKERAAFIKEYLIERGISAARLTAEGYGSRFPKTKKNDEASRRTNRRVELKVID